MFYPQKNYFVGWLKSELNFAALQRGYCSLEKFVLFAKPRSKSCLIPIRPFRAVLFVIQLHCYVCSHWACVRFSLGPACSPWPQLLDISLSHLGPTGCVPGSPHTLCLPRPDATSLSAGSHEVLEFQLAKWRLCQEITSSWHGRESSKEATSLLS